MLAADLIIAAGAPRHRVYARWWLVPPFPLVRDDLFYRVHLDVPVFVVGMVACQRDKVCHRGMLRGIHEQLQVRWEHFGGIGVVDGLIEWIN